MNKTKLSPIQKHGARTFIMFFSMIIICLIITIIFSLLTEWILNDAAYNLYGLFVAFATYTMWKTNIRFGWVENIIEKKKNYPLMSAWFEKV